MKSYPLVVIGAGAAGLVIAIGAAKAGKKVLLIEKGPYGGDCTNFGCIPSKSLIASAHTAHAIKEAKKFGIEIVLLAFKANDSLARVRHIVEEVRSHEDSSALAKIGIETLTGSAHFESPHTLRVNGEEIFAKRIVIATGSSPFIPSIKGLKGTPSSLLLPFPFKKKIDRKQSIPRVTYTDPEVASVGLSEEEATKSYNIASYHVPFSSVDRAITAGRTEGFVKIITKKWSSQILGCTIVGPRAGEMPGQITTAMHAKIPLRKLSSLIHPYPTYNQAIRKAADLWLTQTILSIFKRRKHE